MADNDVVSEGCIQGLGTPGAQNVPGTGTGSELYEGLANAEGEHHYSELGKATNSRPAGQRNLSPGRGV
jgi:hypothetical protein